MKSFLGLAGYYRCFVQDFSTIALPLTRLTQKGLNSSEMMIVNGVSKSLNGVLLRLSSLPFLMMAVSVRFTLMHLYQDWVVFCCSMGSRILRETTPLMTWNSERWSLLYRSGDNTCTMRSATYSLITRV